MTTEELILEILQRHDLPIEQQVELFGMGCMSVALVSAIPIIIHFARRAAQAGVGGEQ